MIRALEELDLVDVMSFERVQMGSAIGRATASVEVMRELASAAMAQWTHDLLLAEAERREGLGE